MYLSKKGVIHINIVPKELCRREKITIWNKQDCTQLSLQNESEAGNSGRSIARPIVQSRCEPDTQPNPYHLDVLRTTAAIPDPFVGPMAR